MGAILAAVGAGMAWWTWGAWPDVLIDFGRELYVPWQLLGGKVLYRDIACFNGPLSPYLNALWFQLFGVSLRTLVVCNIAIVAALTLLLRRLLREVADGFAATAGCVAFLALFAFMRSTPRGNYNFICPYSHELLHGMLLSAAALACIAAHRRRPARWWPPLSGLLLGLVFLTKVELFVAAAAALATGWLLECGDARIGVREAAKRLVGILVCAALPLLAAVTLLAQAMPWREALRSALGSSGLTMSGYAAGATFFRMTMGTDHAAANLASMAAWTAGYAVLFGGAALLGRRRSTGGNERLHAGIAFAVTAAALLLLHGRIDWERMARPLPVVTGLSAVAWFAVRRRAASSAGARRRASAALSLCVFSLVMLGKIVLNARIVHYGFALAMPATLVLVVAVLDWLPRWAGGPRGPDLLCRGVGLAALAMAAAGPLNQMRTELATLTQAVGAGADRFRADAPRARILVAAMSELEHRARPGDTLAVMPEGIILNYLVRRENPTPYHFLIPHTVALFGEPRVLDAFAQHPPDWIMLVNRETGEYGARFFGRDYAATLWAWIEQHYRVETTIGATPLQGKGFGVQLLRRGGPAARGD